MKRVLIVIVLLVIFASGALAAERAGVVSMLGGETLAVKCEGSYLTAISVDDTTVRLGCAEVAPAPLPRPTRIGR